VIVKGRSDGKGCGTEILYVNFVWWQRFCAYSGKMRDVGKSLTGGSFGKESFKLLGEEGAWLGFASNLLLEQTMQGTVGRNSLREETGK
jgi:hypothetical protein